VGRSRVVAVLLVAVLVGAADQAGQSRLFGGIHIEADDFTGRRLGSACGIAAWNLAASYYTGDTPESVAACRLP